MTRYLETAIQIGGIVERKNRAYGNGFAKSGEFLRLLFPDGIAPARYDDALLLVRIFDKQMRIATDRDALGESPYEDIAGYGILGAALHKEREFCDGTEAESAASMSATGLHTPGERSDGPVLRRRMPRGRQTSTKESGASRKMS